VKPVISISYPAYNAEQWIGYCSLGLRKLGPAKRLRRSQEALPQKGKAARTPDTLDVCVDEADLRVANGKSGTDRPSPVQGFVHQALGQGNVQARRRLCCRELVTRNAVPGCE
jgi:hypothetical protein